jgi:hypothetical protein
LSLSSCKGIFPYSRISATLSNPSIPVNLGQQISSTLSIIDLLHILNEVDPELHVGDALLRVGADVVPDELLEILLGRHEGLQIGQELETLLVGHF